MMKELSVKINQLRESNIAAEKEINNYRYTTIVSSQTIASSSKTSLFPLFT